MLLRRQTILNARTADGFRVNEGSIVTARVLQVFRASMLVEVYGYQTYLRRNEASNLWVNDIRDFAQVGDEKQVIVTVLERDAGTGEATHMEVSIRGASDDSATELLTGNSYTGTICSFSETAYYVRVTGVPMDVRCPINANHVMDLMDVGDQVKFVVRGVYDGRPTGSIRRINKKAVPTNW
jgi:ribosomal protein S1